MYFPSCISRVMGRLPGEPEDRSLMEVMVELATARGRTGVHSDATLRGRAVERRSRRRDSATAHAIAINAAVERCWRWSEEGKLPIVIDTSPCTYGFKTARAYLTHENQERFDRMTFLDAIEFVHDELLPKLAVKTKSRSVALHPVCSVTKMGIGGKLEALPGHAAKRSRFRWKLVAAASPAIAASCFLS